MFKSENNQITIEQVRKLDEEYTLVDIRDEISFEYGHLSDRFCNRGQQACLLAKVNCPL